MRNTFDPRPRAALARAAVILLAFYGCSPSPDPVAEPGNARESEAEQGAAHWNPFARARSAEPILVPAGTQLNVRTAQTLSTAAHQPGETFTARLEQPLRIGDRLVADRGAEVTGQILLADRGGRVKGTARIGIELTQLRTASGQTVDLATDSYIVHARKTHGKDAKKVGIGAGVGAAIGAIAGGGAGALKGAGAGAGGGTGLVLATRGDPAVIPAESELHFEVANDFSVDVD